MSTDIGGPLQAFPETTWGLIHGLGKRDPEAQRAAIETLCSRYWKPCYTFLARRFDRQSEDAKDLTQGFFTWLLERDVLARYQPDRGSFRGYLKGVLRHYVMHDDRDARRLKRGGGTRTLSLDAGDGALRELISDSAAMTPEQAFDRAWIREVLDVATRRAREHFEGSGRAEQFEVFEAYELSAEAQRPSYKALAERLGITVNAVRNHLFSVRERIRAEARSEIQDTVADGTCLAQEWALVVG